MGARRKIISTTRDLAARQERGQLERNQIRKMERTSWSDNPLKNEREENLLKRDLNQNSPAWLAVVNAGEKDALSAGPRLDGVSREADEDCSAVPTGSWESRQ